MINKSNERKKFRKELKQQMKDKLLSSEQIKTIYYNSDNDSKIFRNLK